MNASVSSKCHVRRYLLLSYWALDLSQLCTDRPIYNDENRSITDRVLDLNTLLCQTDGQHTNRVEGRTPRRGNEILRLPAKSTADKTRQNQHT